MFEVKFLRNNGKEFHFNQKQEYSFKKTFNTVTEFIKWIDSVPHGSVTVVNHSGLSHSEWYAFCQKRHQKMWNERLKYKKEHPEAFWVNQFLTSEYKKKEFHRLLKGGRIEPSHKLPKKYYEKHYL